MPKYLLNDCIVCHIPTLYTYHYSETAHEIIRVNLRYITNIVSRSLGSIILIVWCTLLSLAAPQEIDKVPNEIKYNARY
mgnify:CR=1 FL=1